MAAAGAAAVEAKAAIEAAPANPGVSREALKRLAQNRPEIAALVEGGGDPDQLVGELELLAEGSDDDEIALPAVTARCSDYN